MAGRPVVWQVRAVGVGTAAGAVTPGTTGTIEAGAAGGVTLNIGTAAAELTPRFPISVDPNGIPVRIPPPGVVGEVGADEEVVLDPEPHIPVMPELCSIPEVVDMPEVAEIADEFDNVDDSGIPDVAPVAGAEAPTPIPPPSKLAVDPNIPEGELPRVEQFVPLLGAVIEPVTLGAGLRPGDAISVEPRGIPV